MFSTFELVCATVVILAFFLHYRIQTCALLSSLSPNCHSMPTNVQEKLHKRKADDAEANKGKRKRVSSTTPSSTAQRRPYRKLSIEELEHRLQVTTTQDRILSAKITLNDDKYDTYLREAMLRNCPAPKEALPVHSDYVF